ncbi:3-phosphoshikimate 1-carboxyvinyltransferase [Candidatus Aerophobetes bacterium]|uniref:3-phosphoshikimate 1-carboxyvinyltransferase n=1 Tax=Aerophobetes bacterium TaxID=2030807 RepID=A0A2A4YFF2_UNCAE|nr:MAG: 3-phosphoshikimate 1-carboxyvinyltransferase [Candidatus Aerophobetes bacterium]
MPSYEITPCKVHGKLKIPTSKSHTLRAILFALLAEGKTTIHHYLNSPDTLAMLNAIKLFGAKVQVEESKIRVEGIAGQIKCCENVIDSGNSGIVYRFIAAIAALSDSYTIITGDHSIRHQRPIKPLLEALEQLGCFAKSSRDDDHAPIIIKGPISKNTATLEAKDSQYISALLIAGAFAKKPFEIHVKNPGETPWMMLTLDWLDRFSIKYENHGFKRYKIFGGSKIKGFDYTVPGDFSSAAYPIAAALVTKSSVTIHPIDMNDSQGDKHLIDVLKKMGASIEIDDDKKTLTVNETHKLSGMKIDLNPMIDAITILAVIGCFAEGETLLYNGEIARKKECDRIHCIAKELKKMGADIEERPDGLLIKQSKLNGAKLETHKDHRLVLSLSVAALGASSSSTILDVDVVKKTFPTFYEDMKHLNASIRQIP